jgi:hypothetical protein
VAVLLLISRQYRGIPDEIGAVPVMVGDGEFGSSGSLDAQKG